jgi:hypothetical protein
MCFQSRVLSKDERDRRLFAFFETPTAVAHHLSDTNASEGEKDRSKEDKETAVGRA